MYKKKINRVKRLASDYKQEPRSFKTIKEKPDDEYFAQQLIFRSIINELQKLRKPKINNVQEETRRRI